MADRVSASIAIGGDISRSDYTALAAIIAAEDLSVDWDGEPFEPDHHIEGQALRLYAHEVANGRFEELEALCGELGLAYVRWSDGYTGQWGPHRVVFTGQGEPVSYPANENDETVIGRTQVEQLTTIEAVLEWFAAADFTVPALDIAKPAAEAA